MRKFLLTSTLAALALTLAACNTTPSPTDADQSVLGTMDFDGTMRDLEGQVIPTTAAPVSGTARVQGGLTITFEERTVAAPAVRVVHGSPDTPAVDVLVNDAVAIEDLTYQKQAGPASLPAGKYNVKVNVANTATTAIDANLTLEANKYYAAYAVGFTRAIEALVLRELPFKLGGVGLVRLLHGSPTAPNVDVYLSRPGRDIARLRPVLRNVPFKAASPYFAVAPGQLQVRITPTGTKTVAIDATLEVKGGSLQTAVAADASGGGAPLGAYVVDELAGETPPAPLKSIVEIASSDPQFSTLVTALSSAGLVEAISGAGPFTVFAPTNDAFAKLSALPTGDALKNVLLYHVASGKLEAKDLLKAGKVETLLGSSVKVRFNAKGEIVLNDTVKIVKRDIEASNGVIHVIDAVLIPPKSILEIASSDPRFTTLVGAVQAAGLVEALSGKGPFTVFAPTNDAFAKLEAVPGGEALKQVLLYHVASGAFTAKDLLVKGMVKTLQGKDVHVEFKGGGVVLNGKVKVVIANLEASNGIVHVIDTVLIPPQ
jgi:uncharacterized surface protein with fasciclin (FAS1) repeats